MALGIRFFLIFTMFLSPVLHAQSQWEEWTPGQYEVSMQTRFYETRHNFNGHGEIKPLPKGGRYQIQEAMTTVQYSDSPLTAFELQTPLRNGRVQNRDYQKNLTTITDWSIGYLKIIKNSPWMTEVRLTFPTYTHSPSNDRMIIGQGARSAEVLGRYLIEFNSYECVHRLGVKAFTEGYSTVAPVGLRCFADNLWGTWQLDIGGWFPLTSDSQSKYRHSSINRNSGSSYVFGSPQETRFTGSLGWSRDINERLNVGAGLSHEIYGIRAPYGLGIELSFHYLWPEPPSH